MAAPAPASDNAAKSDVMRPSAALLRVAWAGLVVLTGLAAATLIWPGRLPVWLLIVALCAGSGLALPFFYEAQATGRRAWFVPAGSVFAVCIVLYWPCH